MASVYSYQNEDIIYQVDELIKAGSFFKIIEEKVNTFAAAYKENRNPEHLLTPFLFIRHLIADDFRERTPFLLFLLAEETNNFCNIAKERLHCVIKSLLKDLGLSIHISLEQIHVKFRIVEAPLQFLPFDPSENLPRRGLTVFHCVLTGFSLPEKYILQSTWYCSEHCSGNVITGEVTSAPLCINCLHHMNEYTKFRVVANYRLLKVLPLRSVQTPKIIGKVFRSIIVRLEGKYIIFKKKSVPITQVKIIPFNRRFGGSTFIFRWGIFNCGSIQLPKEGVFSMEGGRTYVKCSQFCCSDVITAKKIDNAPEPDCLFQSISPNVCWNVDLEELDEILQFDGPILCNRNTQNNEIFNPGIFNQSEYQKDDIGSVHSQNIFTDNLKSIIPLPIRQQKDVIISQSILYNSLGVQQRAEQEMSLTISAEIKKEVTIPRPALSNSIAHGQSLQLKSIPFSLEEKEDCLYFPTLPVQHLGNNSQTKDMLQEVLYRNVSLIPQSIVELYEIVLERFSDFAFVYTLSAQMCRDIVPIHSFVTLKMGLLLSIASIGNNQNSAPLPILAIGSDSSSMHLIMNSIGNAAKRFITTLDNVQCVSLLNDNFIEAGPILLANGGVCYLGDGSHLKNINNNKILKDIERGSVILENTPLSYSIKSAVWTFITLYNNNKKEVITFNTLLEIFGVPIIVADTCEESLSESLLAQSCGRTSISQPNELYIPIDDVKTYLDVISKRKCNISRHANEILQKYFIAVRVDRPDCLPQKAFATLNQMSESFAKLAFRDIILPIDVISAIYLAEDFIRSTFGPGICPSPTLIPKNFVGDIDAFIKDFASWLDDYLCRYATDNSENNQL